MVLADVSLCTEAKPRGLTDDFRQGGLCRTMIVFLKAKSTIGCTPKVTFHDAVRVK